MDEKNAGPLQAKLPLARLLLRGSLAIVWLVAAVAGVFAVGGWASTLSLALGIPVLTAGILLVLACMLNLAVALLLVFRWKPRRLAIFQVSLIAGYTVVATVLWPSLWAEALGPLVKNIPIAVAALILGAIEEER
jgi:hypothetical protein